MTTWSSTSSSGKTNPPDPTIPHSTSISNKIQLIQAHRGVYVCGVLWEGKIQAQVLNNSSQKLWADECKDLEYTEKRSISAKLAYFCGGYRNGKECKWISETNSLQKHSQTHIITHKITNQNEIKTPNQHQGTYQRIQRFHRVLKLSLSTSAKTLRHHQGHPQKLQILNQPFPQAPTVTTWQRLPKTTGLY